MKCFFLFLYKEVIKGFIFNIVMINFNDIKAIFFFLYMLKYKTKGVIMINDTIKNFIKNTYQDKTYQINPTAYFYDLNGIKSNILKLQNNMPKQVHLYYAMKANDNHEVLKYISNFPYVKGFEIASSGELEKASKYINLNKLIFTGPGKTEYELEEAIKSKIKLINVESIVEAIRVQKIAEKLKIDHVDILIRINLNYSLSDGTELMSGCSTKMGIDESDCIESIKYIQKLENITIKGIHVFAASGVLNYQSLLKCNRYIFDLVRKIEKEGIKVSIIDFGGGLGIDYTENNCMFDIKKYGNELGKLISKYQFENKEFIMELGTYVVGDAGYYTAQIIDIKKVKGKKHIIIAGGVNHMGLPLEMRRKHPVTIIFMNEKKLYEQEPYVEKELVDISGPLCMVTDKLSWDQYIEKANIGDIVVFRQAGAYCYGEGMHTFLSHMLPKEVIIYEEGR